MTSIRSRAGLSFALALGFGALASAAWAADRETEIGAAKPTYEWDAGPVNGALFETPDGDDTLFKVTDAGNLTITLSDPGPTGEEDVDVELYRANAAGEAEGAPVAVTDEVGTDGETLQAKNLKVGNYLLRTVAFFAVNGTFKGTAKFTGAASLAPVTPGAPGAPAGPSTDAPPSAKLAKVARSVKAAKLKGFKGTASDDKGVAKVEVAVVRKQGSKCTQMTAKGAFAPVPECNGPTSFLTAKGTTKWSVKLPKKLKEGSYTVFARATDSAGQAQGFYTPASSRAFKVK